MNPALQSMSIHVPLCSRETPLLIKQPPPPLSPLPNPPPAPPNNHTSHTLTSIYNIHPWQQMSIFEFGNFSVPHGSHFCH